MTNAKPPNDATVSSEAVQFMQLLCPCWIYDPSTGAILTANPAALALYGYEHAELLEMSVNDLRHKQEHRHLDIHFDASAAATADGRSPTRPPEYWLHRCKSGEELAVGLSALEVTWHGTAARLVFVTDRSALRLARLESKLHQLCMECANDMTVVLSAEINQRGQRTVKYVNRFFEERSGYSRCESIGRDADTFHGPLTHTLDACELQRMNTAMLRAEPVVVELWQYDRQRAPYRVEITMTPVADERGWLHYWVSSHRDIADRALAALARTE